MSQIQHRSVETNGIRMHIAEQGTGPLVVLCQSDHRHAPDRRRALLPALLPGAGSGRGGAGARRARLTIRRLAYSGSGDVHRRDATFANPDSVGMVPRRGGFLSRTVEPTTLPSWLTEADIDFYAGEFARTGFRGGLNWYRNIDRNWELLAPFAGARVMVPALYVAGDRDLVVAFRGMDQLIPNLARFVPNLRETIMLPGCGHWTQQERADEVNRAMVEFLRSL